jgi:uncharacterized protein YecT (DUF1311 family)
MVKKSYLLITLLIASPFSSGASFDCAKAATSVEKLICSNDALSKLDEQLSAVYKGALASSRNKDSIKQQQMEWIKQQRTCANAQCLSQAYQNRIAELTNSLGLGSTSSNVSEQSSQSSPNFYTGKLKLTKGGEFPICNLIFTFLENSKNRISLGHSIDSLGAIKGVTLPEWQEISDEEYLKIIAPESLVNPKAIAARAESKKKFPDWKHYRAKVNFDREVNAEYFVIKGEFNDPNYSSGGSYHILQDEKTLHKDTNQSLYGRIFLYNNETYIFDSDGYGKYFSVSKTSRAVRGIGDYGWCEYHPAD